MPKETTSTPDDLAALLRAAYNARVNLTFVYDPVQDTEYQFGARAVPWGKNLERLMTYAPAPDPLQAGWQAVADAEGAEWLDLDYRFRGFVESSDAQAPD